MKRHKGRIDFWCVADGKLLAQGCPIKTGRIPSSSPSYQIAASGLL
ncbi:hypothetical protein [Methylobacterium sp. B1]|nr:hypothetical protein [Methylobacterium sp. B1]